MERIEFLFFVFLSFVIHSLIWVFLNYSCPKTESLPNLKTGVVVTTNLVFLRRAKQSSYFSKSPNLKESISEEGTITKEIFEFQNSLSYPPLALERGWESECEWEVEIYEGRVLNWNYRKACSHEIFRTTVEKALPSWKFPSSLSKNLRIPVSFKIQSRN